MGMFEWYDWLNDVFHRKKLFEDDLPRFAQTDKVSGWDWMICLSGKDGVGRVGNEWPKQIPRIPCSFGQTTNTVQVLKTHQVQLNYSFFVKH